jgi:hypothetical protein
MVYQAQHRAHHPLSEQVRALRAAVLARLAAVRSKGLVRPISARTGGLLAAALLAAVGAFFVSQALRLDLGRAELPGPGLFPFSLGAMLLACAAAIAHQCWRSRPSELVQFGHRDVLITVAALAAVPLVFEPLGAPLALGLFAIAILVFVGRVAWPLALIAASLGMAGCWYFFSVLLGVELPSGSW